MNKKYIVETMIIRKVGRKSRIFILRPMSEIDMIKLGLLE